MPKGQMGIKPQTNPKCTSQPPEAQGKLYIYYSLWSEILTTFFPM